MYLEAKTGTRLAGKVAQPLSQQGRRTGRLHADDTAQDVQQQLRPRRADVARRPPACLAAASWRLRAALSCDVCRTCKALQRHLRRLGGTCPDRKQS